MTSSWFLREGSGERGPLDSRELRSLARQGQLQPGDEVRREGSTRWVAARSVRGLFDDAREKRGDAPRSREPRTGNAPFDAFLSFANQDRRIVEQVLEVLEASGLRCWVAWRDIPPGASYPETISQAIRGSRTLVVLLSEAANESPYVHREVELAGGCRLPILTFRIEKVQPSGALEFFLRLLQWLDAFEPPLEQHARRLADSIQALAAAGGPPPTKRGSRRSSTNAEARPRRRILGAALAVVVAVLVTSLALWRFGPWGGAPSGGAERASLASEKVEPAPQPVAEASPPAAPQSEPKPDPTDEAIALALRWLAAHQSPDGYWDCDDFMSRCSSSECSGEGEAGHDVGVTGLALLAFLRAGETHIEGSFKKTVKEGLSRLIFVQDDEGCFGERVGQHFMYDHACAALAVVEAYGMTRAKPFREPAQKAVNFILKSQNPYSAWRYASPGDGDSDTSVTGWMVMVLQSAKLGGLTIDDEALLYALGWVDENTDPATGRTGYTDMGGFSSRPSPMVAQFPRENTESMTAVGVLIRFLCGRTASNDPMIDKGAKRMSNLLPRWSPETGHIDFYYWYYGTQAMSRIEGPRRDRWMKAIVETLVDNQRSKKRECEFGSWDPVDPWASAGGRIYSTALNCLSLQVARKVGKPR